MSLITVKKINISKSVAPLKVGIAVLFCLFFGSQIFKSEVRNNKIMWAFLLVCSIIWLIKNIFKVRLLKNLYLIDSILAASEKSTVPIFTIADKAGLSEKKALRLMKKFLKKKYLHDCTLEIEGEPRVIITVPTEDGREDRKLVCPDCGTVFIATTGAVARCPECASIINI